MAEPSTRTSVHPDATGRPEPPPVTPRAPGPPPVPQRITDDARQLPVHRGKITRITDHAQGIVNSLTDWIELRIALAKREVKDEVEAVTNQASTLAKVYGMAAGAGLVALLAAFFVGGFGFVAIASIWLPLSSALVVGWAVYTLLAALFAFLLLKRAQRTQQQLPLFRKDKEVTANLPRRDDPSESRDVARDPRASNTLGRGSTGA